MTASVQVKKSTNVRSGDALPWIRRGVGALQAVAPAAAARAAVHLFFRTRRMPESDEGRALTASARPFTVPLGGERLAAWSWGEGPAVLLVHGWNGRATQLGAFVEPLVASGLRAVAFDHVGHGDSSGSSTTIPQMAEAIATVARASGGASAVIAHSLGAGAAVLAMHDGLAVERAALIAPPLTPDPWFAHFGRVLGLDERTTAIARAEVEKHVGRRFEELHVPTLASSLRQPALIVHDRDDREIPVGAGEALSYAWRGSRFLVTAGLGHKRILGSPGVLESVRRFVLAEND